MTNLAVDVFAGILVLEKVDIWSGAGSGDKGETEEIKEDKGETEEIKEDKGEAEQI